MGCRIYIYDYYHSTNIKHIQITTISSKSSSAKERKKKLRNQTPAHTHTHAKQKFNYDHRCKRTINKSLTCLCVYQINIRKTVHRGRCFFLNEN